MTTFTLVIIISCILYLKDKNSRFVTLVNRIPGPKTVLFLGNFLPVLMVPKHGKNDTVSLFTNMIKNHIIHFAT